MNEEPIPFYLPAIGDAEIDEVVATLRSGWLTTGPKTRQFEAEFAAAVGARHAVAVNSATAALHLALDAVGIVPGDEVLVPTLTFAATAEVVIHLGAVPVLVDCRADTLNIDPERVSAAITPRTRAIMPMHYGGQPCDMDAILEIAHRQGLRVIEDAAHALPASFRGRRIGTIGDVTCYSFYANKTITTGEGGMLVTNDDAVAERARIMSLHGISKDAWKRFTAEGTWYYEIHHAGFKYNLTDIAAALGIHQLRRAADFRTARAECARRYDEALADLPQIEKPYVAPDVEHSWHLYPIRLRLEQLSINRQQFIERMTAAGIGTSVHWMPLHMHPYYRDRFGYKPEDYPVARAAFERLVSLPIFPGLTAAQQHRVVDAIRTIVSGQECR